MKVCVKNVKKKNKKNKRVKMSDKIKKAVDIYRKDYIDEILEE